MAATRTALVAGSFDPMTNGHLDVVVRAHALFEIVIVAVLMNPGKASLLSLDDRLALARESTAHLGGVTVVGFDGLLVDVAARHGATVVVRGLRSVSDYEHEWPMARMNAALAPGLETVYLQASPQWGHVSSSLVRQIHLMGGDVAPFVPAAVARGLARAPAARRDARE